MDLTSAAVQNLISPVILFFLPGLFAALSKSSLTIPETLSKRQAPERAVALGAAWRGA
jgi:hypothetical protein